MRYISVFALVAVVFGFVAFASPVFGAPVACDARYTTAITGVNEADCKNVPGAKFCEVNALPEGCYLPGAGEATTIGGALQLVNRLTNWMVTILVLFGIFYGIIGAFQFLTSAGEEKKLETGKKKIYYAIGGVVLGLLVKGIITLLVNFVGTL